MKNRKTVLALVLLIVSCAIGWGLFNSRYIIVNGDVFSRSATEVILSGQKLPNAERLQKLSNLENLDLRNIEVQPEEYEQLQAQLPDCNILWKVPFQDGYSDNTASGVTVVRMNGEEMARIKYFTGLQTVDARGCRDYDALLALQAAYPELSVMYTVNVGDAELRENTTEWTVSSEDVSQLLASLAYLPELQTLDARQCTDYETLMAIMEVRPEMNMLYAVSIGGVSHPGDAAQVTLNDADGQEALRLLKYLPNLTDVFFTGVVPDNEVMYQLKCQYPDVILHWDFELFGVQTCSTATELILSNIPMESTAEVEDALKYFYNLERVEMCDCGISSEDMDALNKRHPDTRFVWMVHIGIGSLRTDAIGCIPYHLHYNLHRPFYDKEAKDLKYCTDLIALDLGHMMVTDLSFLQYMPKLKYLVLGDMELVEDFSYIANLTELVFLEIFQTKFTDVSLLMNMKKLEDLNISWTKLENPELLKEMTWLKRLWCTSIGTSQEELKELAAALPNTLVYYKSLHPTEGGWRNSQNYRDMRDALNMFYMQ